MVIATRSPGPGTRAWRRRSNTSIRSTPQCSDRALMDQPGPSPGRVPSGARPGRSAGPPRRRQASRPSGSGVGRHRGTSGTRPPPAPGRRARSRGVGSLVWVAAAGRSTGAILRRRRNISSTLPPATSPRHSGHWSWSRHVSQVPSNIHDRLMQCRQSSSGWPSRACHGPRCDGTRSSPSRTEQSRMRPTMLSCRSMALGGIQPLPRTARGVATPRGAQNSPQ